MSILAISLNNVYEWIILILVYVGIFSRMFPPIVLSLFPIPAIFWLIKNIIYSVSCRCVGVPTQD